MTLFKRSRKIDRRAFLRGSTGAIVLLPFSDFLVMDGKIVAAEAEGVPKRFFTMFFPNGIAPELFNYNSALAGLAATGVAPLSTIAVNLVNPAGRGGPFDNHGNGGATVFTGMRIPDYGPKRHVLSGDQDTYISEIAFNQAGGPTAEHFAAATLQPSTLLKTIVFGTMQTETHHVNMFGRHAMVKSWAAADKPIECLRTPVEMFNKIFGPEWENAVSSDKVGRQNTQSVLDTVMAQYKEVTSERYGLSAAGKARLGEHLDSLNDLGKRLAEQRTALSEACQVKPDAPGTLGVDVPYDMFDQNFALQWQVLIKAFECDIVRFGHVAFGGTAQYYSNAAFDPTRKSGHVAAHEGNKPLFNTYVTHYMNLFAGFFKALNEKIESNGKSMLYNSLFCVGSDLADQSTLGHAVEPASMLVVGAAGGAVPFQGPAGSYFDVGGGRTVNDVLSACMRALGTGVTTFGQPEYNTAPLF